MGAQKWETLSEVVFDFPRLEVFLVSEESHIESVKCDDLGQFCHLAREVERLTSDAKVTITKRYHPPTVTPAANSAASNSRALDQLLDTDTFINLPQ